MISLFKKFWKKSIFQIALTFCLVMLISLFFYWGAQLVLNANTPFVAVSTRSMSILNEGTISGWTYPFERTLQMGDLLVIQGINPDKLNANYPDSDIIVFHRPDNPREIVIHRIVGKTEINNELSFFTKGDGASQHKWPDPIDSAYFDQWQNNSDHLSQNAINQRLIEGKVVMRIPWAGYIALLVESSLSGLELDYSNIAIFTLVIMMMPVLFIFRFAKLRRN